MCVWFNSGRGISSECEGQACYPPRKQFPISAVAFWVLWHMRGLTKKKPKKMRWQPESSTKLWINSLANKRAKKRQTGDETKVHVILPKKSKSQLHMPEKSHKNNPKKVLCSKTWKRWTQWQEGYFCEGVARGGGGGGSRGAEGGSRRGRLAYLGWGPETETVTVTGSSRRWSQKGKCQSSSFAVSEVL